MFVVIWLLSSSFSGHAFWFLRCLVPASLEFSGFGGFVPSLIAPYDFDAHINGTCFLAHARSQHLGFSVYALVDMPCGHLSGKVLWCPLSAASSL